MKWYIKPITWRAWLIMEMLVAIVTTIAWLMVLFRPWNYLVDVFENKVYRK